MASRFADHILGLARDEQDARLGRKVVAEGLLSQAAVDALVRENEGASLRALLLRDALVSPDRLRSLEAALVDDDWNRPAGQLAPIPLEVAAADHPERQLAEFVLVDLLGRGGAAEVWRAWDRRLSRYVAVKLSNAALPSQAARERFLREATAVARLDHPGIMPIHQVGAVDGRPYLVMRQIDGRTLDGLSLPLPEALRVVRDAARAIAHAHERGIVHRDLKPGNLMLDESGHVWVLDFGLVHLREAGAGVTNPGDVLGTAAYMSPEQATGSPAAHEPTTDVYGLGATLYQLVTGSPPFTGPSFEAIVAQVVHGELVRPRRRRPELPADVDRVVRRAMDRDPARRHQSAAALAQDLDRVIMGRPIARPLRLGRRHVRAMIGAAALMGLLGGAASWVRARTARHEEATVATMRGLARTSLEAALRLRRAGDLAGMKQLLPPIEHAYDAATDLRGPARAELEYLMGRLMRASMKHEQALAHQERALANEPDFAPALYERAVHLSREYGRRLARAVAVHRVGGGSPESLERRHPELGALRTRVHADLQRLSSRGPSPDAARAAHGILAFHLGNLDEAKRVLEETVALRPDLEEAWETLAAAAAHREGPKGSERVLTRALAHDAGYTPFWTGRCRARLRQSRLDAASADATHALAMDPDDAEARLCRGTVRLYAAHDRWQLGLPAEQDLSAAEKDLQLALAREVTYEGWWGLGMTRRLRAAEALDAGGNPGPHLDAAEAAFDRAIATDAEGSIGWRGRGWVRLLRGKYSARTGADPRPALDAAAADLTRSLTLTETAAARELRAEALTERAAYSFAAGSDPADDLRAAEAEIVRAGKVSDFGLVRRAALRLLQGRVLASRGHDPTAAWSSADVDIESARAHLPTARARAELRLALELARNSIAASGGTPHRR